MLWNVVLNLENTHELHSIGYETLGILDRHMDSVKDVSIMVKIQVIQSDEEKHSLPQDLARVLSQENSEVTDTIVDTMGEQKVETLKVHSLIIASTSLILARKLEKYSDPKNKNIRYKLTWTEISHTIAQELFRYIYSDKVDNAEARVNKLLPLSTRFNLPGLTTLCERVLLENLTPNNTGNILLLADQCGSESLKKAPLYYCEESDSVQIVTDMVKIQVIQSDEEKYSLSHDLTRVLSQENVDLRDTIMDTIGEQHIETSKVHSLIIASKRHVVGNWRNKFIVLDTLTLFHLTLNFFFFDDIRYKLTLTEISHTIAQKLFRYICSQSDKMDSVEA